MIRFPGAMRLASFVARVQSKDVVMPQGRPESEAPVFQIDYATWHARLAGMTRSTDSVPS
jgi:hypothetical protein